MVSVHEFEDDESIDDNSILLRRVSPHHLNPAHVDADGRRRLTSQCFQDYSADAAKDLGLPGPCMSVGLKLILQTEQRDPREMLRGFPQHGLAEVRAGDARHLTGPNGDNWAQGIMSNPTDSEPWHAVVFFVNTPKKTKGVMNAL